MTAKISKTNDEWADLNDRLAAIRMSSHERLKAQAHLARAEAFADFVAATYKAVARLFHGAGKAPGRAAPSAG